MPETNHNHQWKSYTIGTVDLGKTIRFCECGFAIINDVDNPELRKC